MEIKRSKKKKMDWHDIDFAKANQKVLDFQYRITLAYEDNDLNRVKQLQENLVQSWSAIYVAVRSVTSSKGGKTPGVDGIVWTTKNDKEEAATLLKKLTGRTQFYQASPVRRVEVPKVNGKMRPLGIPTMIDRAYQTLWNLALIPVAECIDDERSYGARPYRCAQDSMTYLWLVLVPRKRQRDNNPFTWFLDADIKEYFDNISHNWLLENIPMDKIILKKWLKANVEIKQNGKRTIIETNAGVLQGGPISPTLANMVLDSLQKLIEESTQQDIVYRILKKEVRIDGKRKVERKASVQTNFVRYVDDFLVICKSKKVIEEKIIPTVEKFLRIRGLELSSEKTKIISTKDGFDYVGFNVRMEKSDGSRHGGGLKIKPSKQNTKDFKAKVKAIIRKNTKATRLIQELNPVLRGWANYYSSVHSKRVFSALDYYITGLLMKWAIRKYRGQNSGGKPKIYSKVFERIGNDKWRFVAKADEGKVISVLIMMSKVPIKRHVIPPDGKNPYHKSDREAFIKNKVKNVKMRDVNRQIQKVAKRTSFLCAVCGEILDVGNTSEVLHTHHVLRKSRKGSDALTNLLVLHEECHMQVTHTQNETLIAKFKKQGIIAHDDGTVEKLVVPGMVGNKTVTENKNKKN